jgi:hypothetical protein
VTGKNIEGARLFKIFTVVLPQNIAVLILMQALATQTFCQTLAPITRLEVEQKLVDASRSVDLRIADVEKSVVQKIETLEKTKAIELKSLEEKFELKKELLISVQKSIDWWIGFLSIFVALVGIAIPYFLTRKLSAEFQRQLEVAQNSISQIKGLEDNARTSAQNLASALETIGKPQALSSGRADLPSKETIDAANLVSQSKEASFAQKLMAKALSSYSAQKFDEAASSLMLYTQEMPTDALGWGRYGQALSKLADSATGEEQIKLRYQAIQKYALSNKFDPLFHGALHNWGYCLSKLADVTEGEKKIHLRREAMQKYQEAINLQPQKPENKYALSGVLLNLAHEDPKNRAEYLVRASILLESVAQIRGRRGYNDACLAAIEGDSSRFVSYAEEAAAHKDSPNREHIDTDRDLNSIRHTSDFLTWYAKRFS